MKNVPLRVIGVLVVARADGLRARPGRRDPRPLLDGRDEDPRRCGADADERDDLDLRRALNPFGIQPKLTGYVNMIFVQARAADEVEKALAEVQQILSARHRIPPGQLPDFDVRNVSQIARRARAAAASSPRCSRRSRRSRSLVGGIGIMNILLVSVTERTREIGLRMAIGARRVHVLLQFLVESVLLSGIGGVSGILAGVAISGAVAWLAGWPILLSPAAIVGGFLFSAAVGVFFGYYPARRARALDPIEALRYE